MDRNTGDSVLRIFTNEVALRKESVDRNDIAELTAHLPLVSLSARRAWIEINVGFPIAAFLLVALRKESVDRNRISRLQRSGTAVALRKESVDRNLLVLVLGIPTSGRSPQGERG